MRRDGKEGMGETDRRSGVGGASEAGERSGSGGAYGGSGSGIYIREVSFALNQRNGIFMDTYGQAVAPTSLPSAVDIFLGRVGVTFRCPTNAMVDQDKASNDL